MRNRVKLARGYFAIGKRYLARVSNLRCRLAGYAYTARFEWLLDTFEREDYCLRSAYSERKTFRAGLGMTGLVLSSLFNLPRTMASHQPDLLPQPTLPRPAVTSRSAVSREL